MQIISKYLYVKSSSQKIRLVINLIKNKNIINAINILNFCKKKSAFLIKKLLKSVIYNFKHNYGYFNINKLVIKKIFSNPGPSSKRVSFRAKGRSDRILKRTSHITIILSDI